MNIFCLEKGTQCYVLESVNTYREITIDRINLLSQKGDMGEVFYNGNEDLTNDVLFVRNTDETFTRVERADMLRHYLVNPPYGRRFAHIKGEVEDVSHLRISDVGYEDGFVRATQYEVEFKGEKYSLLPSDLYPSFALARESVSTRIISKEGNETVVPGLVSLIKPDVNQLVLLEELKSLLSKIKESGLRVVYNESTGKYVFFDESVVEAVYTEDINYEYDDDELYLDEITLRGEIAYELSWHATRLSDYNAFIISRK